MTQYTVLNITAKKALMTLMHLLEKAESHVKEKGIDESSLLTASLAPDMFNFTKQVQVATDDARRNLCLLAGKEHVKMEDNEKTIAELKERINKTREVIDTLRESDFADADERHISLYWMGGAYVLGKDFVTELAIPNLMFHTVTAYGILRAQGLNIGKADFATGLSMHQPTEVKKED